MNNPASDTGIPMLTEILVSAAPPATPPGQFSTPSPSPRAKVTIPPSPPVTGPDPVSDKPEVDQLIDFGIPKLRMQPYEQSALPTLSYADIPAEKWQQLEADITARISRRVLDRIDFILEQRVRDSLADVLQIAVADLSQEIKRGLHQTLEDVISRAVAQESARLRQTNN